MFLEIQSIRQDGFAEHLCGTLINLVLSQLALLPFIIVGLAVLLQGGDGLYWLSPGVIFCYIAALGNAWVLLVEFNR